MRPRPARTHRRAIRRGNERTPRRGIRAMRLRRANGVMRLRRARVIARAKRVAAAREARPSVSAHLIGLATATIAGRAVGSNAVPAVAAPAIWKVLRLVRPKAREVLNNRLVVAALGRAQDLVRKGWGRKAQWVPAVRWGPVRAALGASRKQWGAAIRRCTG